MGCSFISPLPSPARTLSTPCPTTVIFWKLRANPWAQALCSDGSCKREKAVTCYSTAKAGKPPSFIWGRSGSTPHSAEQMGNSKGMKLPQTGRPW